MLEQGDWFLTWDLKSGYHHVDIHPDHYKYLGFAFDFDGQTFLFHSPAFRVSECLLLFYKTPMPAS